MRVRRNQALALNSAPEIQNPAPTDTGNSRPSNRKPAAGDADTIATYRRKSDLDDDFVTWLEAPFAADPREIVTWTINPIEALGYGSSSDDVDGLILQSLEAFRRDVLQLSFSRYDVLSDDLRKTRTVTTFLAYDEELPAEHVVNATHVPDEILESLLSSELVFCEADASEDENLVIKKIIVNADYDLTNSIQFITDIESNRHAVEITSVPPSDRSPVEESLRAGSSARPPLIASVEPMIEKTPTWKSRYGDDLFLSAPEFIAKHYAREIAAGTLTQADVRQRDFGLYRAFHNWRQQPKNRMASLPFSFPPSRASRESDYIARYGDIGKRVLADEREATRKRVQRLRTARRSARYDT